MKRTVLIVSSLLVLSFSLFAQKSEPIKVKAGTRLSDCFAPGERYLYTDFTEGKAILKDGKVHNCFFNYNFLSGEMEFLKLKDTLVIADKNDLLSVIVKQDTFFYDNGYLQQIHSGFVKVYSKQFVKLKEIQKKGTMGTINRSSGSESFDYFLSGSLTYDLVTDTDILLKKEENFYFSISKKDFKPFNRNNIFTLMPWKKEDLKNYIKSNKINFESKNDVLALANYINQSLAKK